MTPKFVGAMLFIITFACLITGFLVYPALPSQMISHWNAAGRANGMMGKFWGVFLLPIMMLVFIGLWTILPRIDPIARGFKGFRYVYDFIWFLIVSFIAYVYALTLGANLGWQFNMSTAIMPALAVLIFCVGVLLPYVKRNWFIGIRTPWTISSDMVWNKTHKLGSKLFEVAGACILIGSFTSPRIALWLIIVPIIAAALISVVYSYVLFRREERGNG
jgi:uncharacterized membrane protein